jgi:nucleotide-binding universal stress UspA family protein
MFTKVLLATDFSEWSRKALDYAIQLKEAGTREVVLVHVIDQRENDMIMRGISGLGESKNSFKEEVFNNLVEKARTNLKNTQLYLEEAGLKVRPHLITGVPYKEILAIADSENVSLIVLGSHGKSNIADMIMGSVSEGVIRNATQPLLVVKRA